MAGGSGVAAGDGGADGAAFFFWRERRPGEERGAFDTGRIIGYPPIVFRECTVLRWGPVTLVRAIKGVCRL